MSANSRTARARSPSASSAITSSQVSAPVTHGLVSTQRMPRPGIDEVVPARRRSAPCAASPADRAAEDRVVPVHRELRLVEEQVAVLAQRVAEPAARELPLRLRLVHQLGERARRRAATGRCSRSPASSASLVDPRRAGPSTTPATTRCRRTAAASTTTQSRPAPDRGPVPARRTASSRRTSQWCQTPTARYADMLVSPLRVLDLARDDLHRPRAVARAGCARTTRRRARRPRPGRRPAAPSRPRRGSRRRCARPTVHGMAPSGSCIAAIDAAVCRDLGGLEHAGRRTARARGSAGIGLAEVEHHALADHRVEHRAGQLQRPAAAS